MDRYGASWENFAKIRLDSPLLAQIHSPCRTLVYRAIALLLSRLTTVNFDVINGFGQNPMQIEFVN